MASSQEDEEEGDDKKKAEVWFKTTPFAGDATTVGTLTWAEYKKMGAMKEDYMHKDWFVSSNLNS